MHKGSTQRAFERFLLEDLAEDEQEFRRFVFLLGAERVVPPEHRCHLYDLLEASERAGYRLTQEFYGVYADTRHDLLNGLIDANPDVEPTEVLSATQRLLDRTLFIAFAEDRSLLPSETLTQAYEHRDPYNPRPTWDNFRGLFRSIDRGNEGLKIPRYNGGLFEEHQLLDRDLVVPDESCRLLKRLGDYNYGKPAEANGHRDEGRLVDVEILGHVFEQSIEDLEAIRAEIEGGEEATRAASRRKREGAFYTPSFVTEYIVKHALQPILEERFERLRDEHGERASGTAVQVLADPRVYDFEELNNPQRDALIAFWEAWIDELKTIRVLDPACGSGAFLIEVFDELHVEYQQAVDRLRELRRGEFAGSLFDPDRTILQNNIYGVDLNEEAVEIARLSIWIKTAQRGKVLTDLDHSLRVGNSIIADPDVDDRAFDWWGAFPEVEAQGGFDVVVGNPPYVRGERLTPIKPYVAEKYETYHGGADLYVYFYEAGVRLLRPGGRLSYIVTNKWLKAGYAEPLRTFFTSSTWVEEVVDLGHAKDVFPDADVFPSIIRVRKPTDSSPPETVDICVIPRDDVDLGSLETQIRARSFRASPDVLVPEGWRLELPAVSELMTRVRDLGIPLSTYIGADPKYGIKTGYNKAYLLTGDERHDLVRRDPGSEDLLKPYLRGRDIGRWCAEWAGLWMLVLPSSGDRTWPWSECEDLSEAEARFAKTLPGVYAHVKTHEDRLRKRSDQGRFWWELRPCDYYDMFAQPKIAHTDIMWRPEFAYVEGPSYLVNTAYMWPTDDLYLLGVVNSPLMWSYLWRHAQHGKDEALRVIYSLIGTLPIADPRAGIRNRVEERVERLLVVRRSRFEETQHLHDWLEMEFGVEKPGRKLAAPQEIDSDTFVEEVRKRRGGSSTLTHAELKRLRTEFEEVTTPLREDARETLRLEGEVSDLVNEAYGLTPDEVDLLWRTAPPRMPDVGRRPRGETT